MADNLYIIIKHIARYEKVLIRFPNFTTQFPANFPPSLREGFHDLRSWKERKGKWKQGWELGYTPRALHVVKGINYKCKELVVYGTNFASTINYPSYTKIVRYMIDIPYNILYPLVGLILSDGDITVHNNNKNKEGGIFTFKHTIPSPRAEHAARVIEKYEYLHSIFLIFSHYCSSYPRFVKTRLNRKELYSIEIVTRSLPCFLVLYEKFYSRGKKRIPNDLYDILTYEGLAYWIMGNGSFGKGGLYLNTRSFTIQECIFIMNVLNIKFRLITSLYYQKGLPVIYLEANSVKIIYPYISSYIVLSMRYKFHYN